MKLRMWVAIILFLPLLTIGTLFGIGLHAQGTCSETFPQVQSLLDQAQTALNGGQMTVAQAFMQAAAALLDQCAAECPAATAIASNLRKVAATSVTDEIEAALQASSGEIAVCLTVASTQAARPTETRTPLSTWTPSPTFTPTPTPTHIPLVEDAITVENIDRLIPLWSVNETTSGSIAPDAVFLATSAFSPDGEMFAVSARNRNIYLLNTLSSQLIQVLTGHQTFVVSIAFTPDGQYLVSSDRERNLFVWDTTTWQLERRLFEGGIVNDIAFKADSSVMATAGSDGMVSLWNMETFEVYERIESTQVINLFGGGTAFVQVMAVGFSSDGFALGFGDENSRVYLWGLNEQRRFLFSDEQEGRISDMAFRPGSLEFATSDRNDFVYIWRRDQSQSIEQLYKEPPRLNNRFGSANVAYSPDGRLLFSHGDFAEIYIWRTDDYSLLRQITAPMSAIDTFSLSPDGRYLVFHSLDGELSIWGIDNGQLTPPPIQSTSAPVATSPTAPPTIEQVIPVCNVTTRSGINLRSGPSTGFAQTGSRPYNDVFRVDAQASDGTYRWWRVADGSTDNGLWVREDVVVESGDCGGLPVVR